MKGFITFLLLCALCFSLIACAVDAPTGPAQDKGKIETTSADTGTPDPSPPPPPPGTGGGG